REAGEIDARVAVRDAVGRLPVPGPVDERVRGKPVVTEPALDLIQGAVADHLRERTEILLVLFVVIHRQRGSRRRGSATKGRDGMLTGYLPHQPRLLRQLIVEPRTADVTSLLPRQLRVE